MASPHGQLHPIIVRNDGKTLITGERRVRAAAIAEKLGLRIRYHKDGLVQTLEPGYLVCRYAGALTERELATAELHENLKRVDLTWQELAAARALFVKMEQEVNPDVTLAELVEKLPSPATPGKKYSDRSGLSTAVILAENMHRPSVAKAANAKEAMKALTREMEQEFRAELAQRQEGIPLDSRHTLIHGDIHVHMARLPSGSVDCILTDPPYGIDADTAFGDMAELDHEYADSPDVARAIYHRLAFEGFRVAKEKAHAYIFLDMYWWPEVSGLFTAAGWQVWPRPLVWDKRGGMLPHPHHGPRYTYELILFANKGHRTVNGVYPDIIQVPNVKAKQHAAQKPVALYENLLARTMAPGEVVLDPCCGSGTVFPAATRQSVQAIGIEMSAKHYALALSRIKEEKEEEARATTLEDL